jgi:Glycosyl transferases group 1
VIATKVIDVAGGPTGGAARFRDELYRYLTKIDRQDVKIIGDKRRIDPAWLVRREVLAPLRGRRIATNNVGFFSPGGSRWTLLRNALHFLTDEEESRLHPSLRAINHRKTAIVRLAARRADVLVVPCTAMAERVIRALPDVRNRVVVRFHPVSACLIPENPRGTSILCPVLFEPYKHMTDRLSEFVTAVHGHIDPSIKLQVTAEPSEVPLILADNPRIDLVGRLNQSDIRRLWGSSRAIFFPSGLESFGYPLAEARVSGQPIIARDTAQNQEIAGPALCGFKLGDPQSLLEATVRAVTTQVTPDASPFDPDSYFTWLLGAEL